jgi:cytochrome o ubiquinol oxidase subunit 1
MRVFDDPSLQIWFVVAAFGAFLILIGIASFLMQIYVSIRNRDTLADLTGDPWDGRTLEWSTSSPPPVYNFAFTLRVHDGDAWWDMKKRGYRRAVEGFRSIHMPSNTGTGVVLAAVSVIFGFGMIWYIWWLAVASVMAMIAIVIGHAFDYHRGFDMPAYEVAGLEDARTQLLNSRR